jgi:hypothetical protein
MAREEGLVQDHTTSRARDLMTGLPWGKFWWRDWLTDPNLSACSLAAQGLWMRCLCIMAHSNPVGHLMLPPSHKNESEARQIARMVLAYGKGVGPLLIELEMRGVFSRDADGTIVSRRMVRDAERSEQGRSHIEKRWGKPNSKPIRGDSHASPKPKGTNGQTQTQTRKESPSPTPRPASGGGASPDLIKAVQQGARSPAVPKGAARGKPFRIINGGAAA